MIYTHILQITAFFLILSSITILILLIGTSLLSAVLAAGLVLKYVFIFVAVVLMVSLCTISSRAIKISGRIITIIIVAVDNC